MFDLELYRKYLITNFIGKNIQYYEALLSTNTKALELASTNIKDGTVIITDNQTAGRGRQSNKWFSIPGKSLTFSVILYPKVLINQINYYSLIAGLAVSDALIDLGITPQLKWPNDILINNKKIGGILCESRLSGNRVNSLVIGIGININEDIDEFPDQLKSISTTVFSVCGEQNKLEIVLANLLNNIEKRINLIDNINEQFIEWENRCGHLNSKITFHQNNEIIKGIFKGLSNNGEAIVLVDGQERIFNSGELGML